MGVTEEQCELKQIEGRGRSERSMKPTADFCWQSCTFEHTTDTLKTVLLQVHPAPCLWNNTKTIVTMPEFDWGW